MDGVKWGSGPCSVKLNPPSGKYDTGNAHQHKEKNMTGRRPPPDNEDRGQDVAQRVG
jgi:hypothetical protein